MGTFFHPITFIGPNGDEVTADGLVDAGAPFSMAPAGLLIGLGVKPTSTVRMLVASGETQAYPLGLVEATIDGEHSPILCLFGPEETPVLIGAHALDAFLLTVDPAEQRLVPKVAYLANRMW